MSSSPLFVFVADFYEDIEVTAESHSGRGLFRSCLQRSHMIMTDKCRDLSSKPCCKF